MQAMISSTHPLSTIARRAWQQGASTDGFVSPSSGNPLTVFVLVLNHTECRMAGPAHHQSRVIRGSVEAIAPRAHPDQAIWFP